MNRAGEDGAGARAVRSLGVVAAALVMLPLRLPNPVAALALAITLAWLPGCLLMDSIRTLRDRGERILASLALSPALAGGAGALLMGLGAAPLLATRIVAAALFIGALWRAFAPRGGDGMRAGDWHAEAAPTAIAPALLWASIVAAFLAANIYLPPRSDGWFHAGVTQQIALRGLPVEDPSYAGLRLLYFWGTDLWAALWLARGPGLAVWTPLITLNVAAAMAVILGVCAIARRLGATRGGQWLAAALAILGYSPFAWVWVVARAAGGEVRGLAELQRLIASGADTALRALGVGQLHASLSTFADKFLVLTPFGLGLALFALFLIALREAADTRGSRPAVLLALVAAAALFTHTVAGFSALAVAGVWGAAELARGGPRRAAALRAALALLAGVALAVPYLLAVTHGKHAAIGPGFSRGAVGSLVLGGALLVPAGAWAAWRFSRARPIAADLLIAMGVLAALGLLLRLPESNQSKFFNLLFLVAAAPAALAILALAERALPPARIVIAIAVALAVLPTAALCAWGFAAERGQSLDSWHFPAPEVMAAWRWLAGHTGRNCVVADEGGAREPMVYAARSALAPGASLERDWGYAPSEVAVRKRASRELATRGPLSSATDSLLRALGREVVVVERRAGAPGDLARQTVAPPANSAGARTGEARREPRYALIRDAGAMAFWRVELPR